MKYIAIAVLLASVSGVTLKQAAEPWSEEGWIEIPKFTDKVTDPNPWGHEVQRLGQDDWLDGHVAEWKKIRATIPAMPAGGPVRAIWDS